MFLKKISKEHNMYGTNTNPEEELTIKPDLLKMYLEEMDKRI